MAKLEILNPVANVMVHKTSLAPRLASLEKKRIGLYWNGKSGGDVALNRIGQLLESRFGGVSFAFIRSGFPGPKERLEEARTFDGVIGGTGD